MSHDPARGAEDERTAAVVHRQRAPMSGSCSAPASRETWRRSSGWWRRTRRSCAPITNTGRRSISPCGRTSSTSRRSCSTTAPIRSAWAATSSKIARDRGYARDGALLESTVCQPARRSPKGEAVAAAIRERDLERCGQLLDAAPELLHAGDGRSNQPIHWAVMTRQIDIIDELLQPRRGHRRAPPGWRASDPAHQRRLPFSRLARRARGLAPTPDEVLAHLLRPRRVLRHLHGRAIGDLERVRELLDQDPSLANRVSDYVYVLRRAAGKRRRRRAHRDRQAAARARRRSEPARGRHRAARPRAVFGRRQRTLRDRQAAARAWRLPESGGRKLGRRAEHRDHELATRG